MSNPRPPYEKSLKPEILPENDVEWIEEEKTSEIDDLKDQLARAFAEIENTRKRLERDKEEKIKYAITSFAKDLLPILDAFDELIKYEDNDAIDMIKNLFENTLANHGLKEIESSPGNLSNPNFHEIISMEKCDIPNGCISKILRKGYTLNGRLIRSAMVIVAE